MGNIESSETQDEDPFQTDTIEGTAHEGTKPVSFDASVLLREGDLKEALVHFPNADLSPIAKNQDKVRKWLNSINQRGSDTLITVDEFSDALSEFGIPREDCHVFFSHLDRYNEGSINALSMLAYLFEPSYSPYNLVSTLVPCRIQPSSVDVYVDNKKFVDNLHKQLMHFLQQNRALAASLVAGHLERHSELMHLRKAYISSSFEKENGLFGETVESDDEGKKVAVQKCYSQVTVSSGVNNAALLDNSSATYWQSNGSPRSHWIRVHLHPGIRVKELSISVDSTDESYMPNQIAVMVGNISSSLREIKSVSIPKEFTGKYILVRNLGAIYKYIQVNIKRCHRDGCDTRVRGIHVKGCKFIKAPQSTPLDSVVMWYISLMAATTQAMLPLAPALKTTLLHQTKLHLGSLEPFALSPTSNKRPAFLDSFVMEELTRFVSTFCGGKEAIGISQADSDEILLKLQYMLLIGNVDGILEVLSQLLENLHISLSCKCLLRQLEAIISEKQSKHAVSMKMKVIHCNGGQKSDEYKVENCLMQLSSEKADSSQPYVTAEGKKIVNMVLEQSDGYLLDVDHIVVAGQKGEQCPKWGLAFLSNEADPSHDLISGPFAKYDTLKEEEFNKMLNHPVKEANKMVHFFCLTDEECTIPFGCADLYKYVCIKFVGMRSQTAERMGIKKIRIFGQSQSEGTPLRYLSTVSRLLPPLTDEEEIPAKTLLLRVLYFVVVMVKDLKIVHDRFRSAGLDPDSVNEEHLSNEHFSLEMIWNLYFPLIIEPDPSSHNLAVLCLLLLYLSIPLLGNQRSTMQPTENDTSKVSRTVLSHLCQVVDSQTESNTLKEIAKEIISIGIPVFFPKSDARKDLLMAMLSSVDKKERQTYSWAIKFKSLCNYFIQQDSFKLLNLPERPSSTADMDMETVFNGLDSILQVVCHEVGGIVEGEVNVEAEMLLKLLQSMQQSLFRWCNLLLVGKDDELKDFASVLIVRYSTALLDKAEGLFMSIDKHFKMPSRLENVQKTVLGTVLPQMLCFLHSIRLSRIIYCLKILPPLKSLGDILNIFSRKYPELFVYTEPVTPSVTNTKDEKEREKDQYVLQVWEREASMHSGGSDMEINVEEKFIAQEATRMTVDFDSSCRTERRFDTLEFIPSEGDKCSYHGSVGTSEWPKQVEFLCPEIQFKFHIGLNYNSWAYKFTVRAYGPPQPEIPFLLDLHLMVTNLMGSLCSDVLGPMVSYKNDADSNKDKEDAELGRKAENWLTGSDAWKTLFRGGITQRINKTLSQGQSSIPAGTSLNEALVTMANGKAHEEFLEQCKTEYTGPWLQHGGEVIDQAVNAVFASLIWHSQEIRDKQTDFSKLKVTQGVKDAFAMAQFMRRELVEARQKIMSAVGSEEGAGNGISVDADKPIRNCLNKALFLLKFAGLTKSGATPQPPSTSQPRSSAFLRKYQQWQKNSGTLTNTSDSSEKQIQDVETEQSLAQKHPSFRVVMEFVRKSNISKEMVERFLLQRQEAARNLHVTLNFILELVKYLNICSPPGLNFLRQLFSRQHNFPEHYIRNLEGCGLELENKVRQAYYSIVEFLLSALRSGGVSIAELTQESALTLEPMLARSYLLHFLDIHWQNYDISFLVEHHIPEFYLATAIQAGFEGSKLLLPKQENEDEMLAQYEIFMAYLTILKSCTSSLEFYSKRKPEGEEQEKDFHTFSVCAQVHTQTKNMYVQCDGCKTKIPAESVWYRNLDSMDMDLCDTCFIHHPEKRPVNFSSDHRFLQLRYVCNKCLLRINHHRLHCDSKDDYDLCLGCFRRAEKEGMISVSDGWKIFCLTYIPSKDKVNGYFTTCHELVEGKPLVLKTDIKKVSLMAYLSQHAFLQFCHLCLTAAHALNQPGLSETDDSYRNTSAVMYLDCLKLLAFCLRSAIEHSKGDGATAFEMNTEEAKPTQRPTLLRVTSITDHPEIFNEIGPMEKEVCHSKLDLFLGLLALMLPKDKKKLPTWVTQNPDVEQLLSEKLLPSVIEISQSKTIEHVFQGLSLLTQFLTRISPQISDKAIKVIQSGFGKSSTQSATSGLLTVEYLCSLGARHLKESDFHSAYAVSKVLIHLSRCSEWKPVVTAHLGQCLKLSPQDMNVFWMFCLYTLAGFPNIPCIGSLVYIGEGAAKKLAVITSFPISNQVSLTTLEKRQSVTTTLTGITLEDPLTGCICEFQMENLLKFLHSMIELMEKGNYTIDTYFLLALALKAVRVGLQNESLPKLVKDTRLMSHVANFSQKPTAMDKRWILPHLEVYHVNCYHQKPLDESKAAGSGTNSTEAVVETAVKPKNPKKDLSDPAADIFDTMLDAFNCTPSVLRAAYDITDGDLEKWVMMMQESFTDNVFTPSDQMLEKAKEWEPKSVQSLVEKIEESGDDSGLVNFTPRRIDIKNITAIPETSSLKAKFTVDKKTSEDEKGKDRKVEHESLDLLFNELKKLKEHLVDPSKLLQVSKALAILQARQLLVSILTHWPWELNKALSLKEVFGGLGPMKVFGMLDLIGITETTDEISKVIETLLKHGNPKEMSDLVLVAAECMGELIVGTEVRHSSNSEFTAKVQIPHASSVTISFDEQSNYSDKIILASSADLDSNVATFTGNAAGKIHTLPGDTLYYSIERGSPSDRVWNMTVVGSQMGRFETGYLTLKLWLAEAKNKEWEVPLDKLWQHVVVVACQNSGTKRLDMIGLLLKILELYQDQVTQEPVSLPKMDLGLLKPLWKLYCTVLCDIEEKEKKYELMPDIVRALSELFLMVECLSKELGLGVDLVTELWAEDTFMELFKQGVNNVAYLSLGLGVDTKVSTAFLKAKKNYIPGKVEQQDLDTVVCLSFPAEQVESDNELSSSSSEDSSSASSTTTSPDFTDEDDVLDFFDN